jgi:hypothetical protein
MIMNSVIDLLSYTLSTAFPDMNIYTEQVTQGLVKPAFFIHQIEGVYTQEVGNRYRQEYSLVVRYFSDNPDQDLNADLLAMADDLTEKLETVSYEGETLNGYDMKHEIQDGVLHFFVKLRRYVKRPETGVKMEELEITEGVID